ncbi:hypothetical protein BD779DRAFT_1484033 [Infundibulicybe gibba]|nr:hypothetical protein BD779DRAFT_1484033 [Infundibulicybe gibba]
MSERIVGRPWTDEEDKRLKHAVENYGEFDNWKTIALSVPGRTNKACRKRWLHSLSPSVKKSAWTRDEDKRLTELFNVYGPKWSTIARHITGRTDDACSKRYREALDPNLKKDEWTPEEDHKLLEVYSRIGGRWGKVGQELQRSGLGCRNRWRLLERKKASNRVASASTSSVQHEYQDSPYLEAEPLQPEFPHTDPSQSHWAPYYPPEAYPSLSYPDESLYVVHSFEALQEDITSVSPPIPPFQFSSSSLSAALSDPPRISQPLPPVPSTPEVQFQDPYDPDPGSSASPSPSHCTPDPDPDDPMPVDEFTTNGEAIHSGQLLVQCFPDLSSTTFYQSAGSHTLDNIPNETAWLSPNSHLSQLSAFPYDHSSPQLLINGSFDAECLSSATSTPFGPSSSLSPTSSPNPVSPLELLPSERPLTNSLLFSSDSGPSRSQRRPRKLPSKKLIKPQGQVRLSSMLPLTPDASVLPYACGHEKCWPAEVLESRARFATSKELFEHSKKDHAMDPLADKPFRCALAGCNKSWKSLNGLQYHLQISTAHFRKALSTSFSAQAPGHTDLPQSSSAGSGSDPETSDRAKRTYVCHHLQCFKAYRQPSGLRYHLKHGHPQDMPVQLELVPPTLARQIPAKMRKMRQKALSDPDG